MRSGCGWVVGLSALALVAVFALALNAPTKPPAQGDAVGAEATTRPAPVGLTLVDEPAVLTQGAGLRSAVGRVRNTDTEPRSGFVSVTLFDAEGKIVGTAAGAVSNLQPGEEATYNGAISSTVPQPARLEARVSSQSRVRS